MSLSTGRARYTLTGTVGRLGLVDAAHSSGGEAEATRSTTGGLSLQLADAETGRVVWSGAVNRSVEVGGSGAAGGLRTGSGS